MSESVIVCEGFLDRAFWAGWLEHLGCTDPGMRPGKPGRLPVKGPGGPATGGEFGFHSNSGKFIRIVPCQGKSSVLEEARDRLDQDRDRLARGASEPLATRLIVCVDSDVDVSAPAQATGFRVEDLLALVQQFDSNATATADGDVAVFGGGSIVSLVRWETGDPPLPGVPDRQTLERVVCSALVASYPQRCQPLSVWLYSRPDAPAAGPKEHAWSYMAGWYADHGCEAFYRVLWSDAKIVAELEKRLRAGGSWRIAEGLAQ